MLPLVRFFCIGLVLIAVAHASGSCHRKGAKIVEKGKEEALQDSLLDTLNVLAQKEDSLRLDTTLLLFFSKGPCFGYCPVYDLEVYLSGRMRYHAKQFTERAGLYEGKLTNEELEQLVQRIDRLRFDTMSPRYPKDPNLVIVDLPSTTIEVLYRGKYIRIVDNHSAPPSLKKFEKEVETKLRFHPSLQAVKTAE